MSGVTGAHTQQPTQQNPCLVQQLKQNRSRDYNVRPIFQSESAAAHLIFNDNKVSAVC